MNNQMLNLSSLPEVAPDEIYTQEGIEKQSSDISTIAMRILKTWKNPHFGARPYISAMLSLHLINDSYGCDSARSIIRYFLANASSFRGSEAREIKSQLKELIS